MATLQRQFSVNAPAEAVWDAVRDFHAVHRRLAPGFVTDSKPDGDARVVTFANGNVAREMLVSCHDDTRRLAYAVHNDRVQHYNAAVQVTDAAEEACTVTWTVDVLPHALADYVAAQMDAALKAMQPTLLAQTAHGGVNATSRAGFNATTVRTYDRGRPEYALAHVRQVLDVLLPHGAGAVVEVGAGSGKFTRPLWQALQERFGAASELTCVEPSDMAQALEAARLPVRLLRTTADSMAAIADGAATAVVCANSFHWFANEPSLRELRRILRAQGRLGLVYFGGWHEDPYWNRRLRDIIAPFFDGSAPHLQQPHDLGCFGDTLKPLLTSTPYFGAMETATYAGGWDFDADGMVAYVQSFSMVAKQPQSVRNQVEQDVRAMLALPETRAYGREQDGVTLYHMPMSMRFIWLEARG